MIVIESPSMPATVRTVSTVVLYDFALTGSSAGKRTGIGSVFAAFETSGRSNARFGNDPTGTATPPSSVAVNPSTWPRVSPPPRSHRKPSGGKQCYTYEFVGFNWGGKQSES